MHYTQTQRAGNFESAAGGNHRTREHDERAVKGALQQRRTAAKGVHERRKKGKNARLLTLVYTFYYQEGRPLCAKDGLTALQKPKGAPRRTFCNEMMPRRTLPAHTFALVYNMTTYPAPKLAQPRQSQETT